MSRSKRTSIGSGISETEEGAVEQALQAIMIDIREMGFDPTKATIIKRRTPDGKTRFIVQIQK